MSEFKLVSEEAPKFNYKDLVIFGAASMEVEYSSGEVKTLILLGCGTKKEAGIIVDAYNMKDVVKWRTVNPTLLKFEDQ